MIDENFRVYLIECNTNPSLEICSPLLARIIPELLDNSFRLAVDPIYQPPFLLQQTWEEKNGLSLESNSVKKTDVKLDHLPNQVAKHRRRLEMISHIKYTLVFDE